MQKIWHFISDSNFYINASLIAMAMVNDRIGRNSASIKMLNTVQWLDGQKGVWFIWYYFLFITPPCC